MNSPSATYQITMNVRISVYRHVTFAAATLLWLLPGHPVLSSISGAIDPLNASVLALLWLCFYGLEWQKKPNFRHVFLTGLFVVASGISVLSYFQTPVSGLLAKYYANSRFQPPVERSWRYANETFTRIDPAIQFAPVGFSFFKPYFSLPFSNDAKTRLWKRDQTQKTDKYQFSAKWSGFIAIPTGVDTLILDASGGQAHITVAGLSGKTNQAIAVATGVHPISIGFARDQNEPPQLSLNWNNAGKLETVPSGALMPRSISSIDSTLGWNLRIAGIGLWLTTFIVLIAAAKPVWRTNARTLLWSLFIVLVGYVTYRVERKGGEFGFEILHAGSDALVWETLAREILFGDWLTRAYESVLYQNIAYRYLLAGMHTLVGDSPAQIVWLQGLLMSGVIIWILHSTAQLFNVRTAVIVGLFLLLSPLLTFTYRLLDTFFGVALGYAVLLWLIRYHRAKDGALTWLVLASLAMGAAILVRSNVLPFVVLGSIWLYISDAAHDQKRQLTNVLIFAGVSFMAWSLFGFRNYVVSGQWIALPTSGLVNFWNGNHPPQFAGPTYFSPQVPPYDQLLQMTVGYIVAEPIAFIQRVGIKLAYIVGVDLRDGITIKASILSIWTIGLIGTYTIWRERNIRAELSLFWLWIATVNMPLLFIFPWGYGWRLSGPSLVPLSIIAALSVDYLLRHQNWSRIPATLGTKVKGILRM